MLDNGVRITHGSDFPVEDMDPLAGFYAAVTRLSPDGRSPHGGEGWFVLREPCRRPWGYSRLFKRSHRFPEQRLTRLEALRGKQTP